MEEVWEIRQGGHSKSGAPAPERKRRPRSAQHSGAVTRWVGQGTISTSSTSSGTRRVIDVPAWLATLPMPLTGRYTLMALAGRPSVSVIARSALLISLLLLVFQTLTSCHSAR